MSDKMISISGIWLRNIGDHIQVLAEFDGKWHVVIEEYCPVPLNISHIVEPRGMLKAPVDAL
jgi:hypothetical protein